MCPKVSVIVPVHNAEKHLRQCVDSILNQTEREIELICIDDGSTDSSLDILCQYEQKDPRVKVLHTECRGAGAARNTGLSASSGKYLSFLDSDDFFEPNMLEEVIAAMEDRDSDLAVFGSWVFDTSRNADRYAKWNLRLDLIPNQQVFSWKDMPMHIFNAFGNYTWNKLFKRELILRNNLTFQEISRTNDLLFTCSALIAAESITVINKPFTHYRVNSSTSLQATNDRDPLSFLKAFEALEVHLQKLGSYDELSFSFLNHLLNAISANLDSMHSLESLSLLKETIATKVEPYFSILSKDTLLDQDSPVFKHYKQSVELDLLEYLFWRNTDLKSERENLFWYIDWTEWRLATAEEQAKKLHQEICDQQNSRSKSSKTIEMLKSAFNHH